MARVMIAGGKGRTAHRARGGGSDGTALGRGGSGAFGLERGDGDGGELEVDVKLGFWPNLFFF